MVSYRTAWVTLRLIQSDTLALVIRAYRSSKYHGLNLGVNLVLSASSPVEAEMVEWACSKNCAVSNLFFTAVIIISCTERLPNFLFAAEKFHLSGQSMSSVCRIRTISRIKFFAFVLFSGGFGGTCSKSAVNGPRKKHTTSLLSSASLLR
uniref:(northern house mosquito) hypothetical protein n=1 Tax=Culex pipiens TaxID=7175 RepID=A0A8D8BWJ5_CULPI